MRAAVPATSPALEAFDRIAAEDPVSPDFVEHSVGRAAGASSDRLTYYFDVDRRGREVLALVGERFARLCGALGVTLPEPLRAALVDAVPQHPEVLQAVLGIDGGTREVALRVKHYLVLRGPGTTLVGALLAACGEAPPDGAALDRTYIVGVDVSAHGVDDVKLYFRLDPKRLPASFENASDIADVLGGCREIVFQQCCRRRERRQLYLHVSNPSVLEAWLAAHGGAACLAHARRVSEHLPGQTLAPWIASIACHGRRLALDEGHVYFHPTASPAK